MHEKSIAVKRMNYMPVTADPRGRSNPSEGYAALFATIVIWSTPSLFMYYLNRYYDPWAQNFYRYLVACIAIAPLVIFRIQRSGPRFDWHAVMICFLPCLPNVVHQVTQVMALSYMGPGVYTIFTRAVWFQPGWEAGHIALPGLFIAFTATFCWALYGILVKRPSAQLGSIRSFGLISSITSALLLPLTFAFGKIGTPLHAGAQVNLILIVSAVSCITLAHVLYYVAIREIGVALAQTLQLLCPAGAMGLSAWIYGERLSHAQIWSAAILLLGAFLAMRIKPIATTEAAENI